MSTAKGTKLPDPPASLSAEAKVRWQSVMATLPNPRTVNLDLLATYCQVWVRWRAAEDAIAKSGQLVKDHQQRVVKSPLLQVSKDAAQQLRVLEERLGVDTQAPPDEGGLLTRRELATALHVHMMTVTKWEREGLPIADRGRKGKASRYREADVSAWLKAREEAKTTAPDFMVARTRKELAQALEAEQRVAMRSSDLVSRRLVEERFTTYCTLIKTAMLSVPSKLKNRLPDLAPADLAVLDAVIREALKAAAGIRVVDAAHQDASADGAVA